jgi:hypothetical protein
MNSRRISGSLLRPFQKMKLNLPTKIRIPLYPKRKMYGLIDRTGKLIVRALSPMIMMPILN